MRRPAGRRLKVLLSACACEPGKGSDPGVGWNVALEMAKYHDIWVLTRTRNRRAIEAELERAPTPRLCFVYHDLPRWVCRLMQGELSLRLYYYLWQVGAYFVIRRIHRRIRFDLIHHVTLMKYWSPSFLSLLRVPFLWGPVGGGESAPRAFWRDFSPRARGYEWLRNIGRWIAERDPFVRLTARRSALALATTEETAKRLRALGAPVVRVFSLLGLRRKDMDDLIRCSPPHGTRLRFIGIGRLLHWKGFHIGLQAFARADLNGAEYWIVGDGPERRSLEASTRRLGITGRVRFWGWLPRAETLRKLGEAHVLVHPSLHDSGGWVCIEALAAARPVICLDLGGPAVLVTGQVGVKVGARHPDDAVRDLARAMHQMAYDVGLREMMGAAGQQWAVDAFCSEAKGKLLDAIYRDVVNQTG